MKKRELIEAVRATLLVCCFSVTAALAQDKPGPQTPAPASRQADAARPASQRLPDIELKATVTMRELKFETVGDPKVEFTGDPKRETVWEADRKNLPRPVQPGVTYRDAGIQLVITSIFADIERLFSEALTDRPARTEVAEQKSQPPPTTEPTKVTTPPRSKKPGRGGRR